MGLILKVVHLITGIWSFRLSRLERFAAKYKNAKILEIGSGASDFEKFFDSSNEFVKSDYKGKGCLKLDAANFDLFEEYDAILLMSVMEHVPEFWKVVPNCLRALKSHGKLFIISPMFYPIHNGCGIDSIDKDYWRFTEAGLRFLLKDFSYVIIECNGWSKRYPFSYCAIAEKGLVK